MLRNKTSLENNRQSYLFPISIIPAGACRCSFILPYKSCDNLSCDHTISMFGRLAQGGLWAAHVLLLKIHEQKPCKPQPQYLYSIALMLMTVLPNGNANQSQAAGAAVLFHVRFDIMPAEGRLQYCLWADFLIRQKHFFRIFNFHVNIRERESFAYKAFWFRWLWEGLFIRFFRPRIIWGLARFLSVEKQIFRKT